MINLSIPLTSKYAGICCNFIKPPCMKIMRCEFVHEFYTCHAHHKRNLVPSDKEIMRKNWMNVDQFRNKKQMGRPQLDLLFSDGK